MDPIEQESLENKKYATINDISMKTFNQENLKYLNSESSTWKSLKLDEKLILRLQSIGFKKPSKIQCDVIKTFRQVRKLFVQSQNGSGKTLAFSIPAVSVAKERKLDNSTNVPAPQVVIVGDTNSLVLQLYGVIIRIVEDYKDLCVDYIQKGHVVSSEVDILICTPMALHKSFNGKSILLDKVSMLIIDEADNSLSMDKAKIFFIKLIKKHLKAQQPYIILTSATTTKNLSDILDKIQDDDNLLRIEKDVEELTLKNVQQFYIKFGNQDQKLQYLLEIINGVDAQNILIFDNSKNYLMQLCQQLLNVGQKAIVVMSGTHMGFNPKNNDRILNEFMAGKHRILLTTNLLARGIDMRKVTLVINYSLPIKINYDQGFTGYIDPSKKEVDLETYLHRVGRTGRFGDHGIALNFVHPNSIRHIEDIRLKYGADISEINTKTLENLQKNLENIAKLNVQKRQFLQEKI